MPTRGGTNRPRSGSKRGLSEAANTVSAQPPTLTDRIGNAIDGNADGTGGDAYTQFFTLDLPADFVLEAPYNDTPEGATPLTLAEDPASSGYLVAHGLGSIDPAVGGYNQQWNESDYWSFDALAGDKVAVSIDTPESNLNSYVYLYDEAGNGLAGDNDSGPGGDAYISYHEIPSDGTYYVRVGHYAYDATIGNYQLRLDVARGIDLESDASYNNDSLTNADPITLSESGIHRTATAAGLVMSPESSNQDEDIYALGVLNVGNVVELDTRLPGDSNLAPRVRLLDASGNVVADEDGDATDGHFLATISEDGFYYAIMDSRCWVYNGHRYQLTESLLWEDAETVAQGLGGHLATIDDAAEQEFVHTAIGTQDLWIGINDAAEEGTWVWADGTPVAYTNWYSGEPNSGANYDYGYINASNGQWYDGYYNWSRVGLVEWDNTSGLPDGTGPGTLGRYLLDVDISDPVPPRVTDVSRIPAEGATTEELLSSFQVTVSEELNAETVNTPVYDFVTYGGHTYVRTSSTLYWSDAEAFAENLGGHLVTIDDQAEQDFIYTTFGTSDLWIGMNDLDEEGTWGWSSGDPITYTNWYGNEPNSGDGYDCGYIHYGNGQWYDGHTSWSYAGVVEIDSIVDTDADGTPDVVDSHPSDGVNGYDLREAGSDGLFDTADDDVYDLRVSPTYSGGTTIDFASLRRPTA